MTWQSVVVPTLGVVASYLVGAVPFGLIAGKLFKGIDIREHGSKNIGATNVFRVVGKGAGIGVLALDVLKGAGPVLATGALIGRFLPSMEPVNIGLLCGAGAIAGHVAPVYIGFKGGKAVATSLGVMLAIVPLETLVGLGCFVVVVAITRYVSAGSITGATVLPVVVTLTHRQTLLTQSLWLVAACWALGIMVVWRHRSNIRRLAAGTENKLCLTRKDSGERGTKG